MIAKKVVREAQNTHQQDEINPMAGVEWNEAEQDSRMNRGLLTIIAKDWQGRQHAIGTAFIIKCGVGRAVALTAAHNLSHVRTLQSPPQPYRSYAFDELKKVRGIDVDPRLLRAISYEGRSVEGAIIDGLILNEKSDIAFLNISLQEGSDPSHFQSEFMFEETPPSVGDVIAIVSFANLALTVESDDGNGRASFQVERRPILRIGRVLEHHPDGHRLCKGPCIETSIPVFSGMSGGPAMKFVTGGPMRVFGLVCADLDPDDSPTKHDRRIAGRSTVALLPIQSLSRDDAGQEHITLTLDAEHAAGVWHPIEAPPK